MVRNKKEHKEKKRNELDRMREEGTITEQEYNDRIAELEKSHTPFVDTPEARRPPKATSEDIDRIIHGFNDFTAARGMAPAVIMIRRPRVKYGAAAMVVAVLGAMLVHYIH